MDRYGADFGRGSRGRYGREYEQWGASAGYDRDFGFRGSREGSFYDRDFSGYHPREFGGRDFARFTERYDQGFSGRGDPRFDQQRYTGRGRRFPEMRGQGSYGPDWHEHYLMRQRRYPSPWDESHPGQTYSYGLGYGQGRGQFIYK